MQRTWNHNKIINPSLSTLGLTSNLWRTWITKRATTRSLLTQVWPLKNPWYTHASITMVAHVCAFLVALLGCEVNFKEVYHTQKKSFHAISNATVYAFSLRDIHHVYPPLSIRLTQSWYIWPVERLTINQKQISIIQLNTARIIQTSFNLLFYFKKKNTNFTTGLSPTVTYKESIYNERKKIIKNKYNITGMLCSLTYNSNKI